MAEASAWVKTVTDKKKKKKENIDESIQTLSRRLTKVDPSLKQKVKNITLGKEGVVTKLFNFLDKTGREPTQRLISGLLTGKAQTTDESEYFKKNRAAKLAVDILGDWQTYLTLGASGAGKAVLKEGAQQLLTKQLPKQIGEEAAGEVAKRVLAQIPKRPKLAKLRGMSDEAIEASTTGITPSLSIIQKRLGQEAKEIPELAALLKARPGRLQGGIGASVPFRPSKRLSIIPGTTTSKITAPISETLLKTPGVNVALNAITPSRLMKGAGPAGYIAARSADHARNTLEKQIGKNRSFLNEVAAKHELSGELGRVNLSKALHNPDFAAGLNPVQQEGVQQIRGELDRLRDELVSRGVDIGYIEDYVPRVLKSGRSDIFGDVRTVTGAAKAGGGMGLGKGRTVTGKFQDLSEVNQHMEEITGTKNFFKGDEEIYEILHKYSRAAESKIARLDMIDDWTKAGIVKRGKRPPGPDWQSVDADNLLFELRPAGGTKTYLPANIAQEINSRFKPRDLGPLLTGYAKAMRAFKKHVTIPFPGFHARNFMGAFFNNFLGGVKPQRYADFLDMRFGDKGKKWERYGNRTSDEILTLMEDTRTVSDTSMFKLGDQELGAVVPKTRLQQASADTVGKYFGVMEDTMRKTENLMRASAFLEGLETFGDPHLARQFSIVRHGDYDDLTPTEESLKLAMPFYKWMRTNIPYQIQSLSEAPGRHLMVKKTIDDLFADDEEVEDLRAKGVLRDPFIEERGGFLLRGTKDKTPTFMGVDLPVYDLNQLSPREMVSSTVLGGGVSALTGKPMFGDADQTIDKPVLVPKEFFFLKVPGIDKLPGVGQYFSRSPGGDLMVNKRVLTLLSSGPNPIARWQSLVRQVSPSPTLPGTEPVQSDIPMWQRLSSTAAGVRISPQTETIRDIMLNRQKNQLEGLIPDLYRRGYADQYQEVAESERTPAQPTKRLSTRPSRQRRSRR